MPMAKSKPIFLGNVVNDLFDEQINDFEKHIAENGTIIFKFFLHLSKEEQKNRLLRRLEKKEKNWKFSPGDLKERKLWDEYQWCYQELLNKTSTNFAPWYIIPADDKSTSRLLVAEAIVEELSKYGFKVPELPQKYKAEISNYKKQLGSE